MLKELIERREALVRRSQGERERISGAAYAASRRLVLLDLTVAFGRRLGWRPVMIASALLVSLAFGPRRALGWAARAGTLYSVFRQLRRLFRSASS